VLFGICLYRTEGGLERRLGMHYWVVKLALPRKRAKCA
jgi:hypothetical protein